MTKNDILFIIAAGNSSRMNFLPKAASIINGKPNLYRLVELGYKHFEKIYVVSNSKTFKIYSEIIKNFDDKCEVISIKSGEGCGDAVLKSLNHYSVKQYYSDNPIICENPIIMWGDAYMKDDLLFKELLSLDNSFNNSYLVIPVIKENNPYVWFKYKEIDKDTNELTNIMQDDNSNMWFNRKNINNKSYPVMGSAICSMYSKRGEIISNGYHDQSIFKINYVGINDALTTMRNVMKKDDYYQYDEIIFLDVVQYLYNINLPAKIYETKFSVSSFNTEQELTEINKFIKSTKNKQ